MDQDCISSNQLLEVDFVSSVETSTYDNAPDSGVHSSPLVSDGCLQEQRDIQRYDLGVDFEEPEQSEPVGEVCHTDAGELSFATSAQSDAQVCLVTEPNDNFILAVDFT